MGRLLGFPGVPDLLMFGFGIGFTRPLALKFLEKLILKTLNPKPLNPRPLASKMKPSDALTHFGTHPASDPN